MPTTTRPPLPPIGQTTLASFGSFRRLAVRWSWSLALAPILMHPELRPFGAREVSLLARLLER